ncbi:MAG: hypothetical protein GXO75_18950 [Calditrichaeota bacterium]|nr:hypothetical protein [Calditrichota bacterium]
MDKLNRRDFIKTGGVAMGALSSLAATPLFAGEKQTSLPLNLFFSEKDVDTIRARTKLPLFRDYWDSLLKMNIDDDRRFLSDEIDLHNHIRHLARAYTILQREAFVYLMTSDRKRGDLAHLAVQKILQYQKWDYFIEGGKDTIGLQRAPGSTISMCLAYDWMGDVLTTTERKEMLKQIGNKGCEPCYLSLYGMRYPDRVKGWGFDPASSFYADIDFSHWPIILNKTNLKAVPMGALAIGTAALLGIDDRADRWLEMVLYSYHDFVNNFEADGSYKEGSSYWNYTASHMALLVDVLQRKKGIDLFDDVNYIGMMDFILSLQMPQKGHPHECVNFGDSGGSFDSGLGFWIAGESRDGLSQHTALHHAKGHNIFSLIWYDPSVEPSPPTEQEYFKHLDLDWIIARTGYKEDDLVVAMRSGKPSNHEHADRNSVLLKDYGEVLLADVKHPPYDKKDPAWMLRTSPAHNTVLIDGKGHQYHDGSEGTNASHAAAKIVREGKRNGYVFWASDATPAYALVNEDVKSVTRTVIVFQEIPCVVVLDKLFKKKAPSTFSARWHIENKDNKGKSRTGRNSFTILRPGAKFFAVCKGSQNVKIESAKLPIPEEKGIYPYVNVSMPEKARESFLIMIGCPLKGEEQEPRINITQTDRTWHVEVSKGAKKLKLNILDNGKLPEFELKMLEV